MKYLNICIRFVFLLVTLSCINTYAQEDLLSPDEAFKLQQPVVENNSILLRWTIAPDYYLYKDKISVESENVHFKTIVFNGNEKTIKDPTLDTTVVFMNTLAINVPIKSSLAKFNITVNYQGCNKPLGVCYPPQHKTFNITIPDINLANNIDNLQSLNDFLVSTSSANELLNANQAFKFEYVLNKNDIALSWQIATGYHLYRDKIKLKLLAGNAQFKPIKLPAAEHINDAIFGKVWVYKSNTQATIPISYVKTASTIQITYQGCSDSGVCFPPVHQKINLKPTDFSISTTNRQTFNSSTASFGHMSNLSESDQITDNLKNSSFWLVLGTFFVFGLLLSLTPCVFPMIPILSGIIIGQGKSLTTPKAFALSAIYVLSMSVAYTIAGVMAGVFGSNLQAALQNTWVLASFSFIFILLALSMFGFFELQLPRMLQTKINKISNGQKSGTVIGVAIMGFLSALIVGPCVAPPLAGALIYISQTGDAFIGGSALFIMSIGMGIPLVILGTSYGKILPKVGGWMDSIKNVFGTLLLAVALWMAERFLPGWLSVLGWALLLIVSAVYMGSFQNTKDKSGWFKLFKGLGIALFFWGILMLMSIAVGKPSLLEPLSGFKGSTHTTNQQAYNSLKFSSIKSIKDLETVLAQGRPVMLDFYADWCISCKEMEYQTFSNPKVIKLLKNVHLVQADVTDNDDIDKSLMRKISIVGPPAILFFLPNGKEEKSLRVIGFKDPEEFSQIIKKFLTVYKSKN